MAPPVGPEARGEALEGEAVDDVGDGAVAELAVPLVGGVLRLAADVVELEAGGDDDGADRLDDQLVLLLVVDGAGAADLLADAALAALEPGAVLPVDHRRVGDRLGKGDVDGRAHAEVAVEGVGDLLLRALGAADAAAGAFVLVHRAGLLAHRHLEVADVPLDVLHLGVGVEGDVGVVGDVDHLRRHDALGAVEGREGLGEHRHVPAQGGLALHQHHLVAGVGDVEGRLDAGDAAADDQRPLGHRDGDVGELVGLLHPRHHHLHDVDGLGRRLGAVLVHPGAVLADVGHLAQVGVEPRGLGGVAEGLLVHARRAGGHHDPVEPVFGDRLLEQALPGVGAHVLVVGGEGDAGQLGGGRRHLFHIDGAGDVLPAVTDKNTDSGHIVFPCRGEFLAVGVCHAPTRCDRYGPYSSPFPCSSPCGLTSRPSRPSWPAGTPTARPSSWVR